MTGTEIIDDVRRALTGAADRLVVDLPARTDARVVAPLRSSTRVRSGWILPALAAATVVIMTLAVVALMHRKDVGAAAKLSVAGNTANVGGVVFPVPDGWQVAVVAENSTAVTVCAGVVPASPCDGVQLVIAVPDWDGSTELLPAGQMFDDCDEGGRSGRHIMTDDTPHDLAGRLAIHYWGNCGGSGPVDHLWELGDMSLQISTPAGMYDDEGSAIAGGLDLSGWAHAVGPQAIFVTSATAAT